jgi:hypothetical protein
MMRDFGKRDFGKRSLSLAHALRAVVRVLAVAGLAALASEPAHAQSKVGTSFGSFTLIEPDARFAALGMAGSAAAEGLAGAWYNPGAVALTDKHAVEFVHADWLAGIRYDWLGYSHPFGFGNIYATFTSLNSGDIPVRTVAQPLGTGELFSVSDIALGVGVAHKFSLRFAAAVQVNYLQETIFHSSAGTATFTAGTLYRMSANGLRIGASLSNFGTHASFSGDNLAITYDNVPGQNGDNGALPGERSTDAFAVPVAFRVGLAQPVVLGSTTRLLFAVDAVHPSDNSESVGMGAEATFRDALSLRAGWQGLLLQDSEVGLTAGAGFRGTLDTVHYHVDYAWADQGRLDNTQRFSFGITF